MDEGHTSDGPVWRGRNRRTPARGKVAEVVAREILHEIVDQDLKPGSQLPAEAEMLEAYGVARASLREALRILEVHGLIAIRPGPGGGPVVAAIDGVVLGQTMTFFLQAIGATLGEVVQARLTLEPLMAKQAAERANPEFLEQLRTSVAGSNEILDDDAYLASTTRFHEVVAAGSGNRVLDLLAASFKEIHVARVRSAVYQPHERAKLLRDHQEISAVICSGDGDLAEELMREHMTEYVTFMEERFQGFMDERIDWF